MDVLKRDRAVNSAVSEIFYLKPVPTRYDVARIIREVYNHAESEGFMSAVKEMSDAVIARNIRESDDAHRGNDQ